MLCKVPSLSSFLTNEVLYNRGQESFSCILGARLAEGCYGAVVVMERELPNNNKTTKNNPNMCLVTKRSGNLILKWDRKASIPGTPRCGSSLSYCRSEGGMQIMLQLLGVLHFLLGGWHRHEQLLKFYCEEKWSRYKLVLAPQMCYFCYQIVQLGVWVMLCLVFPCLLGSLSYIRVCSHCSEGYNVQKKHLALLGNQILYVEILNVAGVSCKLWMFISLDSA